MPNLRIDDAAWSSAWRDFGLSGKVLLSGGFLGIALILPVWPASVLVALTSAALILGPAGTSPSTTLRSLVIPLSFIALGSLPVAVSISIDPSWTVQIDAGTLSRAAETAGRATAGTMAVLLLALTTPITDLLDGLRRAGVPTACVEVASLTYRMLFMLIDSTRTIRQSQAARLGDDSLARSLRSSGSLAATVLTRSWDRASRLERGLVSRGYTGELPTAHDPPRTSVSFALSTTAGITGIAAVAFFLESWS
ncbi:MULTISPECIES: cobalt ECF transporter T component CbiQ [unclassified Aeromicrobium]|uniref:cobalt ECF transporter T component CbiQ n=1 Tax=unclassified Aeromicrobium TaxID=2633570 RepID=UPI00288A80AC|nr:MULTISPECIES: cobalt ECF transporter T component CbiQ [unclassified Aeromicrobium]